MGTSGRMKTGRFSDGIPAVYSEFCRQQNLCLPTAGLPENKRGGDGLVEVLLDATRNYEARLTPERLWGWQAALFPTGYSGMFKIRTGGWRSGSHKRGLSFLCVWI